MGTNPRDDDEAAEGQFEEPVVLLEGERLIESLTAALHHVENEEAEYWIRTCLQQLVAQNALGQNRRERRNSGD
jgi:hypothetical protein